jgi:hypothetical protein
MGTPTKDSLNDIITHALHCCKVSEPWKTLQALTDCIYIYHHDWPQTIIIIILYLTFFYIFLMSKLSNPNAAVRRYIRQKYEVIISKHYIILARQSDHASIINKL